ncbi:hypothetical protein E0Z10_g2837 [Xylaria hypoxylon]|uniref:Uncharacterized protein n=1 Tax=Xylaria hypoxylon TaxID=37992 RepID=A0A4Z0ZBF7_9PEZI|nr:hypothetical protein E0Z10_g2837 [Xylaria hypoxylon]
MTAQQNMSEYYDKSTPTFRGQEWVPIIRKYYLPPQDIDQYSSRALPQLPTVARSRPQSSSSSIYNLEEDHASRDTPRYLFPTSNFAGEIDEDALEMIQPPQITIPTHPLAGEHPDVVSPQPQRPDSKLITMWAEGDELVSPIDTPGTANWKTYVVSPLSENFERGASSEAGQASIDCASWFDDISSGEEERPDSSNRARKKDQFTDSAFSEVSERKPNYRYSDPGSPITLGFEIGGFGEPGPDVGGSQHFDNASGRQTVQPQMHYSGGEKEHSQDSNAHIGESKISFSVPKIDTFSSDRPRVSQRRVPPPLKLRQQSVQDEYVKTPFPPRSDSVPSERSLTKSDEPGIKQRKRRSGLGGFGSLRRRPSTQNSQTPPPGFTEILSQLDNQGVVSPMPRARGLLSKAKHGLGIGSDESKREKRREEFNRQVRRNAE